MNRLVILSKETTMDGLQGSHFLQHHQSMWVWVKIKRSGERRFWFMFPLARVPFQATYL